MYAMVGNGLRSLYRLTVAVQETKRKPMHMYQARGYGTDAVINKKADDTAGWPRTPHLDSKFGRLVFAELPWTLAGSVQ